MREYLATLTVTAGLAVFIPACGMSSTTGNGIPETSVISHSTVPILPSRPQEIDLAGVDTCALLNPAQQQQLGTDTPPKLSNYSDHYGNQSCGYDKILSNPRFGYSVKIVTQEDVRVYLTGERDVTARVVSVAGFPAVENRSPGDDRGCFVDVSTKDGQYLSVQYGESTGSNDTTEVACEKARVAAEMAMQTLLAQR